MKELPNDIESLKVIIKQLLEEIKQLKIENVKIENAEFRGHLELNNSQLKPCRNSLLPASCYLNRLKARV
ncbi:MAG: hypothetical protein KAH84_04815 [Thiomargarita sp.]|nr:hypothetical protein [Thiomargarita sp.]